MLLKRTILLHIRVEVNIIFLILKKTWISGSSNDPESFLSPRDSKSNRFDFYFKNLKKLIRVLHLKIYYSL